MLIIHKMLDMKVFKIALITNEILRKIGLAKLYYWFNK
jgi:hypothetical protein